MCLVSDKIKFCTCLSSSTNRLKHYWILHRYDKYKRDDVVGIPMFSPEFILNYEENKETILKRINEADAFDFDTDFKEKDHLEIVLNNSNAEISKIAFYCFIFKNGKWQETEFDTFHLMSWFNEHQFGKIKGLKK